MAAGRPHALLCVEESAQLSQHGSHHSAVPGAGGAKYQTDINMGPYSKVRGRYGTKPGARSITAEVARAQRHPQSRCRALSNDTQI